jgi:hypothetical protein
MFVGAEMNFHPGSILGAQGDFEVLAAAANFSG